jgi:hypothetical protein
VIPHQFTVARIGVHDHQNTQQGRDNFFQLLFMLRKMNYRTLLIA